MNNKHALNLRLTALAASLLLAFGSASAQESDEVAKLISPDSSISVGAGYVGGEGRRFGEYTGQNTGGTYFLGDADINKRDDLTGTWWMFKAHNLGLSDRDMRLEYEKQGSLAVFLEYGELTHYDPLTFTTALGGAGTYNQTVNAAGSPTTDYQGQITRKNTRLGFDKIIDNTWSVQVRFRNEDKEGSRNSGFYDVGNHISFTTEPVNQNTKEVGASLNYTGENLLLSGGYFGSFFTNDSNHYAVNGAVGAYSASIDQNMSLPQDNEAHNIYLSGNYKFTPTTRGVFKLSYTRGLQNNNFDAPLAVGLPNTSLDGRIDTTALTFGLSSHPISKLSVNANVRYENREDKTPILRYFNVSPSYTGSGYNNDTSRKNIAAKVDATYRLPMQFSLVGGVDWAQVTRTEPISRALDWRHTTDEWTARLGLRRALADNLNGTVSLSHSDRTGSAYDPTTTYAKSFGDFYNNGAITSITPSFINPITWADRKRDKVKASVDWTPLDALSVQLAAQSTWDTYGAFNGSPVGNNNGRSSLYSLDATYTVSDNTNLNAWAMRSDTHMAQRTNMAYQNNVALSPWSVDLANLGKSVGVGANFKPTEKIKLAAEYQWSLDNDDYPMQGLLVTSAPTITTRHATLKLSGDYAYSRNLGFKVQYVYDKMSSNDWTWAGESEYGDGTSVNAHLTESINYIGIMAYYKF